MYLAILKNLTANKHLRLAGLALVCLLIGFLCGHRTAPVRTVTVDKLVYQDRVVTVEKVITKVEQAKSTDMQHDVRYVRVRDVRPDGTRTETVTRTDLGHDKTTDVTKASESDVRVVEHTVYVDKLVTKTVEPARPKWGVEFMPGYDLALRKTVLGGSVQRRLFGPVSVGLWGNSSFMAGAVVRLEF